MIRRISVVAVVCLLLAACAPPQDPKVRADVTAKYEELYAAVKNRRGEVAFDMLDQESKQWVQSMLDAAARAGEPDIAQLGPYETLWVLRLRHSYCDTELATVAPREVFASAMSNGWLFYGTWPHEASELLETGGGDVAVWAEPKMKELTSNDWLLRGLWPSPELWQYRAMRYGEKVVIEGDTAWASPDPSMEIPFWHFTREGEEWRVNITRAMEHIDGHTAAQAASKQLQPREAVQQFLDEELAGAGDAALWAGPKPCEGAEEDAVDEADGA